ncbi:OmpA family protein [Xanthobacter autotrophicus]|uniref:OmpA family protein n=1 Tax=Xanthobacter autotrophicus TaxID=280 RepID=UPI0037265323
MVSADGYEPKPGSGSDPGPEPRPGRGTAWPSLWPLVLGLATFALLCAFTLAAARGPIEADLDSAAADILARTGEGWAFARFEGRDATLEGEALAEEARAKVRGSLEGLFGVRVVHDATTILPERRPFTFGAVKDGRVIALDGYVPSADALGRIVAAARSGGDQVAGQERLVRARGAPPGDFAALVTFGLAQLKKLPSGRITLADGAIGIEGRARDLASYDALAQTMLGPLPDGMVLARFAVRPPVASPFFWSAVRDGTVLRLSGFVPSSEARGEVAAALSSAVPGIGIKDDTRLADGAPATELWLKAVRFAGQVLFELPEGRVTLSDSTIAVEGAAPSFPAFDQLLAQRRAPPDGFQIVRFAVEPPRAAPFTWRIERFPESVRLSGYAPSDEARRLLVDATRAAFPGVQVADDMQLASGGPAPELWASAASFAVAQLVKLRTGAADVAGTQVTLSGEAADSVTFLNVMQAVRSPPAGVSVVAQALSPPTISPYVFSVRREGDELTVSGFYPDAAAHTAIRAALERDFLREKVNDVSAVGGGAPDGFLPAVLSGLTQLSRVGAGEISIVDGQLRLTGTALTPAAASEMDAELKRAVRPPFMVETAIDAALAPPPADTATCSRQVGELLARGTIRFASGSAEIDRHSRGLIDRLAVVLKRCPNAVVRILGHTDGVGDAEFNKRLSETRANAVLTYLVTAGVATDRLSAAGFGAGQPLAPNDTEAGKALNRRIEFEVKERAP